MRNQHRFTADASLDGVTTSHQRACTYPRATSPPLIMKYVATPELHREGGETASTTWASFLPINCGTPIEDVSTEGVRTGDPREQNASVIFVLRNVNER